MAVVITVTDLKASQLQKDDVNPAPMPPVWKIVATESAADHFGAPEIAARESLSGVTEPHD